MDSEYMFNRKIIDITTKLEDSTIEYDGLEGYKREWLRRIDDENDNKLNMSKISLNSHAGTHVDAPLHFIKDGKSIDQIPIKDLMGKAQIIEVSNPKTVTAEFLRDEYKGTKIVLFKFSRNRLDKKYDYFDKNAIDFLLENKVTTIGTDNFIPDNKETKYNAHYWILENEMWIIQGLNLEGVKPGIYDFICLPVKAVGLEAASARAVLLTN